MTQLHDKNTSKDLEKGIRAIRARIHHLRNQHRDNVGAQFFLNLCEQGMPQAIEFMTRYAEQGFALELKPNEQAALQKAAETTSMTARTSDLGFGRNVRHHLLNRRNLLTLAGASIAGGSAIVWSRSKTAISETLEQANADISLERRRKFDEIAAEIIEESKPVIRSRDQNVAPKRGRIDEEKLLSSISDRLRVGEESKKNQDGVDDFIKLSLTGVALTAAFVYAVSHVTVSTYSEINNKKAHIIEDLDQFCRHKLNRLPAVTLSSRNR